MLNESFRSNQMYRLGEVKEKTENLENNTYST